MNSKRSSGGWGALVGKGWVWKAGSLSSPQAPGTARCPPSQAVSGESLSPSAPCRAGAGRGPSAGGHASPLMGTGCCRVNMRLRGGSALGGAEGPAPRWSRRTGVGACRVHSSRLLRF